MTFRRSVTLVVLLVFACVAFFALRPRPAVTPAASAPETDVQGTGLGVASAGTWKMRPFVP